MRGRAIKHRGPVFVKRVPSDDRVVLHSEAEVCEAMGLSDVRQVPWKPKERNDA